MKVCDIGGYTRAYIAAALASPPGTLFPIGPHNGLRQLTRVNMIHKTGTEAVGHRYLPRSMPGMGMYGTLLVLASFIVIASVRI